MPKKKTQEQCIADFRRVHGDEYDYSKVVYKGKDTPVNIICRIHGIFPQTPHNHIQGAGCPYCGYEKTRMKNTMQNKEFEEKANKVHNWHYIYNRTDLFHRDEDGKVIITCPIHGDFKMTPHCHLQGYGCKECGKEIKRRKQSMSTDVFIPKASEIHKNKYKYNKTKLENRKDKKSKIIVTCPIHGDFEITAHEHLMGRGCPHCNASKLEQEIKGFLIENKIIFEYQKHFEWLGLKSLDFYLPKYNIAIECQGIQHFEVVDFSGHNAERAINEYKQTQIRDNTKLDLCTNHGIRILYYANYDYDFPYEVFTDKNKLINEIKRWQEPSITTDTADSEITEISE